MKPAGFGSIKKKPPDPTKNVDKKSGGLASMFKKSSLEKPLKVGATPNGVQKQTEKIKSFKTMDLKEKKITDKTKDDNI